MAAHGQFANGSSRLDVTESMAPGGMMDKGTTTFVDPAKQQYMELNPAEMAKQAAGLQQALGGLSKTEILDLHIDMEDLGAGEKIEGYATLKYRLTESYTMKITVMGRANQTNQHSVSEIWVAPQLDGIMNPSARPAAAGAAIGPMAEAATRVGFRRAPRGADHDLCRNHRMGRLHAPGHSHQPRPLDVPGYHRRVDHLAHRHA